MAKLHLQETVNVDSWGTGITAGEFYSTIDDSNHHRFFITINPMSNNEPRWWKVLYYDAKISSSARICDIWVSPNVYEKAT